MAAHQDRRRALDLLQVLVEERLVAPVLLVGGGDELELVEPPRPRTQRVAPGPGSRRARAPDDVGLGDRIGLRRGTRAVDPIGEREGFEGRRAGDEPVGEVHERVVVHAGRHDKEASHKAHVDLLGPDDDDRVRRRELPETRQHGVGSRRIEADDRRRSRLRESNRHRVVGVALADADEDHRIREARAPGVSVPPRRARERQEGRDPEADDRQEPRLPDPARLARRRLAHGTSGIEFEGTG